MANADFERWEARFSGPDYLFGTEPNAFLRRHASRLPRGGKILAVADGEGRNGVWLAEQGFDVTSLDFSPTALAKARALAQARGVTLRTEQADLAGWPWPPEAFDGIVAIFIQFAAPPLRRAIFDGIKRTLRPGGVLLMQGYRPEQLGYRTGGPSSEENLYTRPLLAEAFADFAEIEIAEYDSAIHEGSGHSGMSALIDLIGRK